MKEITFEEKWQFILKKLRLVSRWDFEDYNSRRMILNWKSFNHLSPIIKELNKREDKSSHILIVNLIYEHYNGKENNI